MIYRQALIADIPEMQRIRHLVKENRLSDPALVPDTDVETYITRRGRGWVCESEGILLGFAIADLQDDSIWALFVDPDAEKKGIGSRLQRDMLNWYFQQNKKEVWLSTAPGTRAEQFYLRTGWTATGTTKSGEIRFEMNRNTWLSLHPAQP